MNTRAVRGKTPRVKQSGPAREDHENLHNVCEQCFSLLPSIPNGEVLSKGGAIKAVQLARDHFSQEMKLRNASPSPKKAHEQLQRLAALAEKASICMSKANEHIKELNEELNNLEFDAIDRIGVVPSPTLRLLNESGSDWSGLLKLPYKKALEALVGGNLPDGDEDVLRSELFRFLASRLRRPYATVLDEEQIARINSLKAVCARAAISKGITIHGPGQREAFKAFRLYPSQQLVEACMAILKSANLTFGNSKHGLLVELATAIRQSVEGTDADEVTSTIENLPIRTTDRVKRLDARVKYWKLCLLIDDLESLPKLDPKGRTKLNQLKEEKNEWRILVSIKATPTKLIRSTGKVEFEIGPWNDIDEESPFR